MQGGDVPRVVRGYCICAAVLLVTVLASGCSKAAGTYDELVANGTIEKTVREEYVPFFAAIRALSGVSGSSADSALAKKASIAADKVIADVREFPGTARSRLALDALSYAADDLARSQGFGWKIAADFWDMALLDPIFVVGKEYMRTGTPNISTHIQIVNALKRGIGSHANARHFYDMLTVVGTVPPPRVMAIAEKDSLLLRKVFNVIIYGRGCQQAPPPSWMVAGPWFATVRMPGAYPMFFALVPVVVDDEPFLVLRTYEPGDVYAVLFHDPIPADSKKYDEWLARGSVAMDSLKINSDFADSVRTVRLPVWDAHYFQNDYLITTAADSVKKLFIISLKRDKIVQDGYHFSGADSLALTFSQESAKNPGGPVIEVPVFRHQDTTMYGRQTIPAKTQTGTAYLMPLGVHNNTALRRIAGKSKDVVIPVPK